MTLKKIMVVGVTGSGKTTFCQKLSEKINFPLYHLDRYFFTDNWQERPFTDFMHDLNDILHKDQWIIDGNSMHTFSHRLPFAETIIYFKFNRFVCFWGIVKRHFQRLVSKEKNFADRAENCPEKITWKLLKYTWLWYC